MKYSSGYRGEHNTYSYTNQEISRMRIVGDSSAVGHGAWEAAPGRVPEFEPISILTHGDGTYHT